MSVPASDSPRRKSILESPWYWVYAFCTVALAALVLMTPKFGERQAQIERQAQGRERAAQQRAGKVPSTPMSTSEATSISLRPIMLLLAGVLAAAWSMLWWRHFRRAGDGAGAKRDDRNDARRSGIRQNSEGKPVGIPANSATSPSAAGAKP